MKIIFTILYSFVCTMLFSQVQKNYELPTCENYFDSIAQKVVYTQPDSFPKFPGEADAMTKFIKNNLTYPAMAGDIDVEGRIYIQVFVEPDGSITNKRVTRGLHKFFDEEALRVIDKMPKWIPGKCDGLPVTCKVYIPVMFTP